MLIRPLEPHDRPEWLRLRRARLPRGEGARQGRGADGPIGRIRRDPAGLRTKSPG